MAKVNFKKIFAIVNLVLLLGTFFVFIGEPIAVKAAPPTNTTAATAIEIPSLPYSTTQDVHDAGTTYTVWYKYTAVAGENEIGIFGFGDLVTYRPTTRIYVDEFGTTLLGIAALNKPVQIPVTPGNTYYFSFAPNAGNPTPAVLTLDVITSPADDSAVGDLLIPDDTEGFPGVILSSVDGEVVRFANPFPAGEQGDVLPLSGNILVSDEWTDINYKLYDDGLNLITDVALSWDGIPRIRANTGANNFYVGDSGGGLVDASITTIDVDGNIGPTTWTLPSAGLTALAASNDETVLYHAGQGGSLSAPLKRWDLVLDSAMTDLVAGLANYGIQDIIVLPDDTILVNYFKPSVPRDLIVKRFDDTGALLNTYNFGSDHTSTTPRMASAIDSPNSFWIWTHVDSTNGLSRFFNIKISDGTTLNTLDSSEYEGGAYVGDTTATPTDRFGISFSCPFIILRGIVSSPVDIDLVAVKTASDLTPIEGDLITYTVTVTNEGPDDATGIEVTDVLPAEVTYVSHVASQGTYDQTTWLVGDLANGISATLDITVTVDAGTAGTPFDNTATISTPSDSDATDNADTVSITSSEPPASGGGGGSVISPNINLTISKTSSNNTPQEGQVIVYTITVTNTGPGNANSVIVAEPLPAGLTLVSSDASQGIYAAGTWSVGSLSSGATATLKLTTTVNAGTGGSNIENIATITSPPNAVSSTAVAGASITVLPPPATPPATSTNTTSNPLPTTGFPLIVFPIIFGSANFSVWLVMIIYKEIERRKNRILLILNNQTIYYAYVRAD